MNEKRINLRFRENNEMDMKAWELLEKAVKEKNASRNSLLIELILSALEQKNSDDALAERIAEMVVSKLDAVTIQREATGGTGAALVKNNEIKAEAEPQVDEPELLGEEAIGFLDVFG